MKQRYEDLYGKRGEEEDDFERKTREKDSVGQQLPSEIKKNIKDIS